MCRRPKSLVRPTEESAPTEADGREGRQQAPFSRPSPVFLLLPAGVGAAIVLAATHHGASTSPDSVEYIAAARSLLAGKGYLGSTG